MSSSRSTYRPYIPAESPWSWIADVYIPGSTERFMPPSNLEEYLNMPLPYYVTLPSECMRRRRRDDPDDTASNKRARLATLRRQLPEVAPPDDDVHDDCAICLQDLFDADPDDSPEEGATPRAMPCSHVFHERCIFRWVELKGACPLCRQTPPPPRRDPKPQDYDYHDDDLLQRTMPVPRDRLEIEVI